MKRNPFWNQEATKTRSKHKILKAIKEKPSTFGELRQETGLSKPVLGKYLAEFIDDKMIKRDLNGKRIEYLLTAKGKTLEQQWREGMAEALGMLRPLIKNYEAVKSLSTMAELAKEAPELFEGMLQFVTEYLPLMVSDDMKYWIHTHGKKDAIKDLQKEVLRRMRRFPERENPEDSLEDIVSFFRDFPNTVREIITTNNRRRP